MKITLIQMDIQWAEPHDNMLHARQLMDRAPVSDLYVLPEMFSTGFATTPQGIADEHNLALRWMQEQASFRQAAICGSVAVLAEDGTFRNRFYFVQPDGQTIHYDKHHLFTYGGEDKHYSRGTERVIIEWRGIRILPLVCYDLRFPIWSRNNAPSTEDGLYYDMLIYVASWPASRQDAWNTLLRARAIENQCYVMAVNRIGTDNLCTYQGGTQAIDAYGRIVATCPDDASTSLTIDLDMERLQRFRQKFPVLKDADTSEPQSESMGSDPTDSPIN